MATWQGLRDVRNTEGQGDVHYNLPRAVRPSSCEPLNASSRRTDGVTQATDSPGMQLSSKPAGGADSHVEAHRAASPSSVVPTAGTTLLW